MTNAEEFTRSAEMGDFTKVHEFITMGINVDEANSAGETALMLSSMKGHIEIVKYLLENGADVNKFSRTQWTALCFAATRNHYDVVDILINAGADVNAICQNDCTILEWVIRQQDNRKYMVKQLIEQGAEIRARSLQIAKNNSEDEILLLLNSSFIGTEAVSEENQKAESKQTKPWWKIW